MNLDQAVLQLDAAAEPSRLRLLVALLGGEMPVGDLVAVMEQSQPRVSRHLRLLLEAGLVESFREGRSIYYRWSAQGLAAGVAKPVAAVAASNDPTITADRARLTGRSRQRERDALRRALKGGGAKGLHAADAAAAIRELLGTIPADELPAEILNVGCGSGELLQLLLPLVQQAVGTEASSHRRQVARARLRQRGLPHWTIRDAVATALPFASDSFDLVLVQDALLPGAEIAGVLAEAVRVLRPRGRLLILDRLLPTNVEVPAQLAALGLTVTSRQWLPGRAPDRALLQASRAEPAAARTGTND
jgi:ArsR family transcriptional regulator